MAWTRNTTSGVLTHAGTTRDFWSPGSAVPALCRIHADCATRADAVGIMVLCTQDGRTGWRCGIDPSDATKVMIRRVVFGVEASNLDDATHGIPAGVPFRLQVELVGNSISVKTIATGYAIAEAAITNNVDPTYVEFRSWGLVSAVNGAVVLAAGIAELTAVQSEVTEVLVVVCGGNVYMAFDEDNIALASSGGSGAFSASADVSLAVLDGVVYGVDGGRINKINVLTRAVLPLGPDDIGTNWDVTTTGAPPGATTATGDERVPGTTTARVAEAHKGRLYLAGMDESPQALYACAVRDPQMWLTTEPVEGRAFALGVERRPGVSYTVLSLTSVADNVLLIGCAKSIELLIGDPIDGFPEVVVASSDTGISGANAVNTGIEGVNIAHSQDAGLLLVPVGGAPIPLSAGVLTELIQFPRGERQDYYVSLVRDPQRHGTHIFLTLRDDDGSVHLWYDEMIGGFQRDTGGFFPETYHDDVGPTCAVNWRGYVVLGGKTGFVWKYDPDRKADEDPDGDDDLAIENRMPLSLMNDEDVMGDTILSYLRVELADDSDAVLLRVYGGATVESAYDLASRERLLSRTVEPYSSPMIYRLRSRALIAELSNETAGESWRLEAVDAETTVGAMLRRGPRHERADAHEKCEPPVATSPPPPPPPPDDGPGAGGSIAPPPGLGMPLPDSFGVRYDAGWSLDTPRDGSSGPPPPPYITQSDSTPAGGWGAA